LPHCDFFERHTILVRASRERVYDAIFSADLTDSFVVRGLLFLRGMGLRRARKIREFASGFRIVGEDRPTEIVLAIEGSFWKVTSLPHGIDAEDFRHQVPAGMARAAWNFTTERQGDKTLLATETRVLCADDAMPKFRLYWMLIRPFSGIIRIMMLRAIRREAER
jgi:hypothetical protein